MGLLDNIDPLSLMAGGVTMMANSRGRNSRQAIPMGLDAFTQYQLLARKQQQEEEDRKQKQAMFDANMELHRLQLEQSKQKKPFVVGKSIVDPETFQPLYTAPETQSAKFGMSPRIGMNEKGQPEYVVFGEDGGIRWTGIRPTPDELKIAEFTDKTGANPYGIPTPQPQQINAPQSVPASSSPMPTSNFSTPYGVTWSGKTATDIAEGTSPDMQLRDPAIPPASRRKLAEKRGEAGIDIAKEQALAPIKTQQAADQAAAVKKAESGAQAQIDLPGYIAKSQQIIKNVDDLVSHPGFAAGVGLSSVFDPRNYIPGTDAMDFQKRMDQVKGQQFMQAYEGLKGGGQITEVEGAKATAAISRMNTAQSEEEFRNAAKEFTDIVKTGMERARAKAGASGAQVMSNSDTIGAIPLPKNPKASNLKKGQVYSTPKGELRWNGMQFEDL